MPKSETQIRLEIAGFKVGTVYPGAKWFEVIAPDGEAGYVLCQSFAAWHYFADGHISTASDSNPTRCHLGGLGDAIGSDSQMRTYKALLSPSRVPKALRDQPSINAAMQQVAND